VNLGAHVIVVGGGNTAIDAARTARRAGASVVILYRRSRAEMPAIAAEVDDALNEGITIEFLSAPVEVRRQDGIVRTVVAQRMALGEPDASGRRRPVRDPGSEFELPADSVIAAISQQPDWDGLEALQSGSPWIIPSDDGECGPCVWTGGDAQGLGLAGMAIGQGRRAAEAVHARLRGLPLPPPDSRVPITPANVKPDFYTPQGRLVSPHLPPADVLRSPDLEVRATIGEAEFLREVSRCYSCGQCFGCEQCFMYCNSSGFVPLDDAAPGAYFEYQRDQCLSCGKCIDLCPCGFLSPT